MLSVETIVTDTIESRSRKDVGTVKIQSRVLNQRGEDVMTLTSLVLYRRRPA